MDPAEVVTGHTPGRRQEKTGSAFEVTIWAWEMVAAEKDDDPGVSVLGATFVGATQVTLFDADGEEVATLSRTGQEEPTI
jgi:hypothetical protein